MSQYYNSKRSADWNYGGSKWRLSRSKIELFLSCPLCFYMDNKLGVKRPPSFPFNLNSAVDTLLKKEFDIHRARKTPHPLMNAYGLDAVPFDDPRVEEWRDALRRGITYKHEKTGFLLSGGVDDVWVNPKGELIIVDYKATSKDGEVNLDADWQEGYKNQMEIYQWLFRQNGFTVSSTGYFVYCNGQTDREAFDGKLEFDIKLIPYKGSTDWVEGTLFDIKKTLVSDVLPSSSENCDYCNYRRAAGMSLKEQVAKVTDKKLPIKKEAKKESKKIVTDGEITLFG